MKQPPPSGDEIRDRDWLLSVAAIWSQPHTASGVTDPWTADTASSTLHRQGTIQYTPVQNSHTPIKTPRHHAYIHLYTTATHLSKHSHVKGVWRKRLHTTLLHTCRQFSLVGERSHASPIPITINYNTRAAARAHALDLYFAESAGCQWFQTVLPCNNLIHGPQPSRSSPHQVSV